MSELLAEKNSKKKSDLPLRKLVKESIEQYFNRLDGEQPSGLYNFVLEETEAPLLEVVLEHTEGNLSKAAILLGISRNTLRKKLQQYNIGDS